MPNNKNTTLAIMTTLNTVGLGIALALHFTPWLHEHDDSTIIVPPTPQNTVELSYTSSELETLQFSPQLNYNEDTLPKYVHIKGEPLNVCHPITLESRTNNGTNIIWVRFEYKPGKTIPISLMKNDIGDDLNATSR